VFHLDAIALGSANAAAGDAIVDGNSMSYEVLFVEHQNLNRIVVVVCRPAG
jgi:hypothetical protein